MIPQSQKGSWLAGWVRVLLPVLMSGILYYYSNGLHGFRPLMWIAPLPLLLAVPHLSGRATLISSLLAYLLGSMDLVEYLAKNLPGPAVIIVLLIPSTVFAFCILGFRKLCLYRGAFEALFIFPFAWTSYEYLISTISPNGTAFSISYTQADFIPIIQIAALTGIWGITFLLALVPAGIALCWHYRNNRKRFLRVGATTLILLLAALGFGSIRSSNGLSETKIKVGLVASDSSARYFATTNHDVAFRIINQYVSKIRDISRRGARIIVLPEKFVGLTHEYEDTVLATFRKTATDNNVAIVAGFNTIGPDLARNHAIVFSVDGKIAADYDKVFLIPGIEWNYTPGNKTSEFVFSELRSGIVICKDMDFPNWIRKYGKSDVRIMFVPAWDFVSDGWLHSRMAVMRGVENGFSIVRSASEGLLTVSDAYGRVIADEQSSAAPIQSLIGDISPGPGMTLYSKTGDWFAWISVFGLLTTLCMLVWRRRKPTNL
ncbi:MAG: nitrilase-related carbon-nitrogen hydrolase [Candidatus Kryptoniota bacterium]